MHYDRLNPRTTGRALVSAEPALLLAAHAVLVGVDRRGVPTITAQRAEDDALVLAAVSPQVGRQETGGWPEAVGEEKHNRSLRRQPAGLPGGRGSTARSLQDPQRIAPVVAFELQLERSIPAV